MAYGRSVSGKILKFGTRAGKWLLAGVLALFLLSVLLHFCESTDERKRIRVVAVFGSEDIPFWEEVREGLRQKAKDCEVVLTEYSPKDESLFPLLIESAYYTDVDAVAICIYESEMWEECQPILAKMREKGIRIIVADTPPEIEDYDVFIGLDNYAIGQKMAENIHQNYKEGQRILMDRFETENLVLGQRRKGCQDRLVELGVGDAIDYIDMPEDTIEQISKLKEYLHKMENSAVLSVFTTKATMNSAEVIRSEGFDEKVRLVGFGESVDAAEYVENGMVDAFFVQDNLSIGSQVIEAAEVLCGGSVPEDRNWDVDVLVYSKEQEDGQ